MGWMVGDDLILIEDDLLAEMTAAALVVELVDYLIVLDVGVSGEDLIDDVAEFHSR